MALGHKTGRLEEARGRKTRYFFSSVLAVQIESLNRVFVPVCLSSQRAKKQAKPSANYVESKLGMWWLLGCWTAGHTSDWACPAVGVYSSATAKCMLNLDGVWGFE